MANRDGKIDSLVDFLENNNIILIDTETIGSVIFDVQFTLNKETDVYEYNELHEVGITDEDIDKLNTFLEANHLMMIKTDELCGVSLESCGYDSSELHYMDLWEESGVEEECNCDEESGVE